MRIGRWSELRVVEVCHRSRGAKEAEHKERSGEVGDP